MSNVRSVFIGFDPHQFAGRRARPVSTRTGLSYEDYAGMQTRTRTQYHIRRKPTPKWALDDDQLREVIVATLECRYALRKGPGSLFARLARTEIAMRRRLPELNALIDRFSREYIVSEDPDRKRRLQIEIEGLDTTVRIAEKLVAILTTTAYLYYRVKMDSVGVADELGIKPPHVRQLLWRMNRVADRVKSRAVV